MTGLTRWDPLKEVEELQNPLSGFFGRAPVRRKNGEQESITGHSSGLAQSSRAASRAKRTPRIQRPVPN